MGRANPIEASVIKECFNNYCEWSGQQANPKKSNILFSKNMRLHEKKELKEILGYNTMRKDSAYLRNTFFLGRNKTKEFQRLKNKVQAIIERWNGHFLSKAGKATLIKSVVQSLPTYTIFTFCVLNKVCRDLDVSIRDFWWKSNKNSRGMVMKAWPKICRPK